MLVVLFSYLRVLVVRVKLIIIKQQKETNIYAFQVLKQGFFILDCVIVFFSFYIYFCILYVHFSI